jgi:hypothetical protein
MLSPHTERITHITSDEWSDTAIYVEAFYDIEQDTTTFSEATSYTVHLCIDEAFVDAIYSGSNLAEALDKAKDESWKRHNMPVYLWVNWDVTCPTQNPIFCLNP